jgi:hypothetical protein
MSFIVLKLNKYNNKFFDLNIIKQIAAETCHDWGIYFNSNSSNDQQPDKDIAQYNNAYIYATMRIIEWILQGNYFSCLYKNIYSHDDTSGSKKLKIDKSYVAFLMGRSCHRKRSITMMIYWFAIWAFYAIKCFTNRDILEKMKINETHDLNSMKVFKDALSYLRISSENSFKEYSELLLISTHGSYRRKGYASALLDEFEYTIKTESQIKDKYGKSTSIPLVLFTTDYCNHDIYEKRKYFKLLEYNSIGGRYNQKQYVYVLEPNIYKRFEEANYTYRNEDEVDINLYNHIRKEKKRQEEIDKLPKFMELKKKVELVKEIDNKLGYASN